MRLSAPFLISLGLAAALAAPAFARASALGLREIGREFHSARAKIKVAFFDADSTLRISSVPGATYPARAQDVVILPEVARHIRALNKEGYLVAIVSNQGEVGRGEASAAAIEFAMAKTVELIGKEGGHVDYYDIAMDLGHDRKPDVGMAETLERNLRKQFGPGAEIDRANSFMVGDAAYLAPQSGRPGDIMPDGRLGTDYSNGDRLFAKNLGIRFEESADFFGWREYGVDKMESQADIDRYLLRSFCDRLLH